MKHPEQLNPETEGRLVVNKDSGEKRREVTWGDENVLDFGIRRGSYTTL